MQETALPESPSTPFGQYQLLEKIAQGGMAEIFKGKALDLNGIERVVVIKRILPHIAASPEFVDMLIDEAKIAVMLSHGNIAQIYDLGKVADDYFIVMEYVEGKTLSQIMRRLRTEGKLMPVSHAASICAEIANGLDYMHRKTDDEGHPLHIVHRDISPQNIILSTAGTVKIIDFGIAKAKTKVSTTDSGVLKGKFAYMSPEHAEGERLDHRTDLFSLGIVLFELLTGQRLFKGKNNPETIRKVKKARVPTPSSTRSAIPKALDEIVLKALQRDREKRYPSAHALAQDLTKYLISHHPDFSPRELSNYLEEIFPEVGPGEKASRQEETPLAARGIRPKEERGETRDETQAAASDIIRAKLKEAEVFNVPPKEHPKISEESRPSVVQIEKRTLPFNFTPFLKGAALMATAGVILFGLLHFYPRWKKERPSEAPRGTIVEKPKVEPTPPPAVITPPQPVPAVGSLSIDSQPRGAQIFLNDAGTNRVTPSLLPQIPAGKEQRIGLYLDRYKFWEGKIQVSKGETLRLQVPLEINYGDLAINSLPPGAEVILNGRSVGKTPFIQKKVPPETGYEVVLKLPGYEAWKGWTKVFGGKREVVNISLKKLPQDSSLP